MQKNVASQKLIVYAWDTTTGAAKTGDGANLTAYVSKDYGTVTVLGDTTATEMDSTNAKGFYLFDLTQAETNADTLLFSCKSSTANVSVLAVPATVFTTPPNFSLESIDSNGRVDVIKIAGTTQTARDIGASVLLSSGTGTGQITINSGVVDVRLADAVSHGGTLGSSTATLALSRLNVTSQTSNTVGVTVAGNGTGAGASVTGGATGDALKLVGGGTSGNGLTVTTTSGHGASITATGASKHGITVSGGNSGTSHGVNLAAGSGGVGLQVDTVTTSGAVTFSSFVIAGNTLTFTTANKIDATVPDTQKVDINTIKTQTVTCAAGVTVGAFVGQGTAAIVVNASGHVSRVTLTDTVTTLTNLPAITANWLTAAGLATDAVNEIVDQVWEETLTDHSGTVGSTAAALNAAGSAGDPWATALPGSYGAGTAGRLLGRSLPDIVAGSAGGLLIAGSNAATTLASLTVSGATTLTGNVAMAAGLTITQSTTDGHGLSITGNGSGNGVYAIGGTTNASGIKAEGGGAGRGLYCLGGSSGGRGAEFLGTLDGTGFRIQGGGSGSGAIGFQVLGGSSAGNAVSITSTAGHGVVITASGTSKHGITITGGSAGTSNAVTLTAGTGGVGLQCDTATFSGAVTLSSTLTVSGATSLAAVSTSGTVTFNALTVTNATTLTGAVSATNASNDIRGVTLASGGLANVTTWTVAITGNITGNLSGSVGSLGVQAKADVNAEADTALADVGLTTTVTGRIDRAISAILTTAMTEAYNADGVAPTPAQALFLIMQRLTEFSISGTTITAKKLDGSTTAFTLTINDATNPTSSTRAT